VSFATSSICLMTGNHLCHNPRVLKSARALARHGFSVEVLGGWSDPVLKERDRELLISLPFKFTPVVDMTQTGLSALFRRVRNKAGRVAHQFANEENRWQLGYCYPELREAAFRCSASLYIAHSEPGMAVAADLLRHGYRVGVDMEDWFSEDLLPEARRQRPVSLLRGLERTLLMNGSYASCPSIAMSAALASEYRCQRPVVIYNACERTGRSDFENAVRDRQNTGRRSIHWYSQTLGRGRGLEDLIAALPRINGEAEIHLRGEPAAGFEDWLKMHVPHNWQDRVFLHGLVNNNELLSRVAEHDIGFAGEMTYCRSRDLTITNKILDYLRAGLAVVASNTAGQQEAACLAPGAVSLYPTGNPGALAECLNGLLESPAVLAGAKAAALQAAEQSFCWRRQERRLLQSVELALSTT
jgi:glycosyltransferase involved in cell wall biosynthesis